MHWAAPRSGAADGRVLADRRTVAYAGRAQHAGDALRVRSTGPVGAAASTFAALQLFYYETLVVSTSDDDDDNNGGGGAADNAAAGGGVGDAAAHSELERLLARADAAAANLRRRVGRSLTAARHPYARLTWRERARRIVHANVRAADALAERESAEEGDDDDEVALMELDDETLRSVAAPAAGDGSGAGNGAATARGLAIHQILTSSGAAAAAANGHAAPGSGTPAQRSSRLLSLSNPRSDDAGSVHYAFTLSSRTLQQIRSRHERRRLRRQQERKRFDHRVAVGFALAAAAPPPRGDGASQSRAATDATTGAAKSSYMHPLLRQPPRAAAAAAGGLEDLGKDAFSLAYSGRSGRVTSNGRVFLQCDRFGAGDVVGCGVLLATKTFFFTLNGRLLGMLAATDVHHFDDFVDDDLAAERRPGGSSGDDGDDDDDDDAAFRTDDDAGGAADSEEDDDDDAGGRSAFEDVLFPALSLHGAGECASATFDAFRFDLAGFARQIQKERQHALLLHELADERDEHASDRAIDALVGDFLLHYGHRDALEAFERRASFAPATGDVRMLDDSDGAERSWRLGALSPASKTLLDVRHAVRRHIYAHETQAALETLQAAFGSAFFAAESAGRTRRQANVLFYARVLCVLDTLQPSGVRNGDAASCGGDGDDAWDVEAAILCAQEQFSGFASSRTAGGSSSETKASTDDELKDVMSLLLYERREDVPATSAARKFLSPQFREFVADELNRLLLEQAAATRSGSQNSKSRARVQQVQQVQEDSRSAAVGSSPASSSTSSALESFLVELNALQAQCLHHGCRVFPGNPSVSSSGLRSRHRQHGRRTRHSADASGNDDDDDDDDEQMSSGSDMSSSSSISENDDDDDNEEEEE